MNFNVGQQQIDEQQATNRKIYLNMVCLNIFTPNYKVHTRPLSNDKLYRFKTYLRIAYYSSYVIIYISISRNKNVTSLLY